MLSSRSIGGGAVADWLQLGSKISRGDEFTLAESLAKMSVFNVSCGG